MSVVTYRSGRHVDACLEGVGRQGACVREVLLVDNASGDGVAARLRRDHADLDVTVLPANRGYAAAHNRNVARARGEYVLVLNPDVMLAPGYLDTLLARFESEPRLGAAAGRLVSRDDRGRLDSAGIAYDRLRTRFVDRGRGTRLVSFAQEEDVFGVCGAAALYRRSALADVSRGGESPFAERLFMYYEDVDLAWRLRRAGWRQRYAPDAEALHERGGSGASAAFVEYHLVRNRLWVSLRNASARELCAELPGLALFEGAKALQACWRPHLRAALRDQWRGVAASLAERRRSSAGAERPPSPRAQRSQAPSPSAQRSQAPSPSAQRSQAPSPSAQRSQAGRA